MTESGIATLPLTTPRNCEGRILVVDDDRMTTRVHSALLSPYFDVATASSGEEAIEACSWEMPDLVLLDIDMPGLNGFDTCRALRSKTNIPILFATGHETPEEHLKAFEAGGSDIFVKPIAAEIMIYKVRRAIAWHREQLQDMQERQTLDAMARDFMTSLDESAALLQFMRSSLGSRSLDDLGHNFVRAAQSLGIQCSLLIRQGSEEIFGNSRGMLTSLERVALSRGREKGKQFRLQKHLGLNTPAITVLISDAPEQGSDKERQVIECVTLLAEAAEALAENVGMRKESSARAEQMQLALANTVTTVDQLRIDHRTMIADVRILLQGLSDQMEQTFSWLAPDRHQEREITQQFNEAVEKILRTLLRGSQFDDNFVQIIEQLKGDTGDDVELF